MNSLGFVRFCTYFVSFTKIALTRSIFRAQNAPNASNARPDPLGELKRTPCPLAVAKGIGENIGRKEKRRGGNGREGKMDTVQQRKYVTKVDPFYTSAAVRTLSDNARFA